MSDTNLTELEKGTSFGISHLNYKKEAAFLPG